ncbi:5-(carboxyamino)imidazole ribonucleotide synthase [Kocuria soli]|uniref:N5-carboxyaminoimidazole ribonucleotide synthase n=2 Tax=Kocuria soli TaxID=2485125 RepID=A0A3N3ZTP4_9MICC|nr:5-(carboxyamino)imidazole ribonucleotide synthase [Kocuria soli]
MSHAHQTPDVTAPTSDPLSTNGRIPSPAPVTGPVVGVIGGGQLARMMGPAATELGVELRVLAEAPDSCAIPAAASHTVGDYRDLATLLSFADGVDVITFDHEHVPNEHLEALLTAGVAVEPRPAALVHAQDKIVMRRAVEKLGLPNPRWAAVKSVEDLVSFADGTWPIVLKTPRGGYDGKGVLVVPSESEARNGTAAAWFAESGFDHLLAEEAVPFTRELSALVARTPSGEVRSWPVVESIQVDGVCDEVLAPAPDLDPEVERAAESAARTLATELGVTGVMAVELFDVPGRGFLVNELAMRPHNSGHWSMDGAVTGQFEQHLRAVLDLPLGDTGLLGRATVMKNVLGGQNADLFSGFTRVMSSVPEAKVHLYGKGVRPGRKVGHVNTTATNTDSEVGSEAAPGPDAEPGQHHQDRVGQTFAVLRARARAAADMLRDGATDASPVG